MRARPSRATILLTLALGGGALLWICRRTGADDPASPSSAAATDGRAQGRGGADPFGVGKDPAFDLRGALRASIGGTIRDDEGSPIAGARVCARARSRLLGTVDTRDARCVESEADGAYRIDGLFGVTHQVNASAPGYIPSAYQRGEGARRRDGVALQPGVEVAAIDITLRGGGVEIRGVVRDLSGGAVEGAQVSVDEAVTISGDDGAFTAWVAPGDRLIEADADGYARGIATGAAPGHVFQVYLTPEAALIGAVVRASDGAPVEGARVTAASGIGWNWGDAVAFTDAAGKFRLGGLSPGAYKAMVRADELYGTADAQVILGLGETSDPLVIRAHPAFAVDGVVVIDGGDTCDDGTVSLVDPANNRHASAPVEAGGAVHLPGVLAGEYQVTVRCTGELAAARYERVTLVDRSLRGLRWSVSHGLSIRGRVVDARGAPAERIRVFARPTMDPAAARSQAAHGSSMTTDRDGRFEIAGVVAGDYALALSSGSTPRAVGDQTTPVTVPEGKDLEGVTLTLPATGEIRGTVVDGDGQAVGRVRVRADAGGHARQVNAADDGTFVLTNLDLGTYRVSANRGFGAALRSPGTGDDDLQGERVILEEGAVETVVLVVEGAAGVITGVVRDEDGGPVADAFIEASRESEQSGAASGGAARMTRWGSIFGDNDPILSDADGRFTVKHLRAGTHTLLAHRKGGGEALAEHVAIGDDVILTIDSTATIRGAVVLVGGGAPEEFQVELRDDARGYQRRDTFFRSDGAWSLSEVPAGDYKVRVTAGAGDAEIDATVRAGVDVDDLRIELAPRITVRGQIVDERGEPVAGIAVNISASGYGGGGGDEDRRNVSDASGRFEVSRAPTGRVYLSASSRISDDFEHTRAPLLLTAGAALVELPPFEVVRRRVDRGETVGDPGFTLAEAAADADPLTRALVVAFVRPGGPAASAGLVAGDEIVRVDGKDVRGPRSYLYYTLLRARPGVVVTLGLARGASVSLTLAER